MTWVRERVVPFCIGLDSRLLGCYTRMRFTLCCVSEASIGLGISWHEHFRIAKKCQDLTGMISPGRVKEWKRPLMH